MAIPGYWVAGYAAVAAPRRLQYPMGWGTLGYALPAALGPARWARPSSWSAVTAGSCSRVGELAAIVQEQLPVVILLVDDGGYGMLRYDQLRAGDHSARRRSRPDRTSSRWPTRSASRPSWSDDPGEPLEAALAHALVESGQPRLVVLEAALTPPRTTSPRWRD